MNDLPPFPFDPLHEFPVKHEWIYLNHAAVSPIPRRTAEAIQNFTETALRHGATHYPEWIATLRRTREKAARLLGAESEEVAFIKSTTHGLLCVANSIDWRGGDNLVTFDGEFPANFWPWKNLERLGVECRVAPLRDGRPELKDLEARIDARTRLAAVSFVGYANGYRLDGAAFGELCRRRRILSCLDGIQGLGAVPVNVNEWGVDFLSADGHKWLLAPEGFGVLFCSNRVVNQLNESMTGWCGRTGYSNYEDHALPLFHNARRFEEGSHNMLCAHAFEASLDLFFEVGMETVSSRIRELTDQLAEGLRRMDWEILSQRDDNHWSGILTAAKKGLDPATTAQALMERNVYVAARGGGVRFSPHFYNDPVEIDRALEMIQKIK